MMEDILRRTTAGFITSTILPSTTPSTLLQDTTQSARAQIQKLLASQGTSRIPGSDAVRIQGETVNGVVIGLLSSFGSALLILIVALVVYWLKYTSSGRILLDRIGRPGEYDDNEQYMREEAEALEEMDDHQRTEYFRAKGRHGLHPAGTRGFEANIVLYQRSFRPTRQTPCPPTSHSHST
jgi:hypothetical protein